ncbi:hypothetical protein, partial [uncultured Ruminococcus sp.]|uniref:hypothetical protein n=1 Tax=uncultured Ruminococcus sp. TaxID=165186 RepID=UPI00266C6E2B
LFFFTEKKKRSKKRKELALHLYLYGNASHEDYTENCGHLGISHRFLQIKKGMSINAAGIIIGTAESRTSGKGQLGGLCRV